MHSFSNVTNMSAVRAGQPVVARGPFSIPVGKSGRRALLLTTALTTTLLIGALAPSPAAAQQAVGITSAAPVVTNNATNCVFSGDCILIATTGDASTVDLTNSGILEAATGGALPPPGDGIDVSTVGNNAAITIDNSGTITAGFPTTVTPTNLSNINSNVAANINADIAGIRATTAGQNSTVTIVNTGDVLANNGIGNAANSTGLLFQDDDNTIDVRTTGVGGSVDVTNSGVLRSGYDAISIVTVGTSAPITLTNSGNIFTGDLSQPLSDGGEAIDIRAYSGVASREFLAGEKVSDPHPGPANSPVTIINSGNIYSDDDGIEVCTAGLENTNCRGGGGNSAVSLTNSGTIIANYVALDVVTYGPDSPITFLNTGNVTSNEESLDAETSGDRSSITITNHGIVNSGIDGVSAGTSAYAPGDGSSITVVNTGDINAGQVGIYASTGQNFTGNGSLIDITNSGLINSGSTANILLEEAGHGIYSHTNGTGSTTKITNTAAITTDPDFSGIFSIAVGNESGIEIINSADIGGGVNGIAVVHEGIITTGDTGIKITNTAANIAGVESGIDITNEGDITTATTGIEVVNAGGTVTGGTSDVKITNNGTVESADAIKVEDASSTIENTGIIAGLLQLTGLGNLFNNQVEGRVETSGASVLGTGDAVFNNAGSVIAALDPGAAETTSFAGLATFNNSDRVSLSDGAEGDTFSLLGPVTFVGLPGSTLAVDTFLGDGDTSDKLVIGGDVTGQTEIEVTNTSMLGGAPNAAGITIVSVEGTVAADAFVLPKGPVDGGFFSYDLFAETVGTTTNFELRSFVGPGAAVLPQLVTATNDIWHGTAGTWADRTADLRAGIGGDSWKSSSAHGHFSNPGLWVRFSGEQLNRAGNTSIDALGNTYEFDLGRSLQTNDVQFGVDFGQRDVSAGGDALVFGVLGGATQGKLAYNTLHREFKFEGGQIGGYATYLNKNLFVDALVKADFYQLGTETSGFPSTLSVRTLGARLDAGYRFGGPHMFVEPLATVAASASTIDGFTVGSNSVEFGDGTSVRGRIGARFGATMHPTEDSKLEPFLAASLWGTLGSGSTAQLTTADETLSFTDGSQGQNWVELSAGVNVFGSDESSNTSGFAKVDATIGKDVSGLGGQLGWRLKW